MLLFSATYTDKVLKFAEVIVPDPVTIRLRREEESLDNIRQFFALCKSHEDKYVALSNMYGMISIGQCIVFCHVSTNKVFSGKCPSQENVMPFEFLFMHL